MKRTTTLLVMVALLAGRSIVIGGDVISDSPAASDLNGQVSFTQGDGGSITVSFPGQSPESVPRYDAATVIAGTASGSAAFSGDYVEAGVEAVSFKISSASSVSQPVNVYLVLRSSGSGRIWRNQNVSASAVAGQLIVNEVSFERSDGWMRDGGGDLDTMWAADLQSVEVIGVRLSPPGNEAMSYTLSDFTISGSTFGVTPAILSPLEQALKDEFGVTTPDALSDEQKGLDFDVDTMENWRVLLSESDDAYANSIFMAQIIDVSGAGVRIKWPTVAGSFYTVIRSASLLDEFVDLTNLLSTTTGFMEHLDTTGFDDGPFFYKIRREP